MNCTISRVCFCVLFAETQWTFVSARIYTIEKYPAETFDVFQVGLLFDRDNSEQ